LQTRVPDFFLSLHFFISAKIHNGDSKYRQILVIFS
jgi:hypothetical protein